MILLVVATTANRTLVQCVDGAATDGEGISKSQDVFEAPGEAIGVEPRLLTFTPSCYRRPYHATKESLRGGLYF